MRANHTRLDAKLITEQNIINKPPASYVTVSNTEGRWGISQSDGNSGSNESCVNEEYSYRIKRKKISRG